MCKFFIQAIEECKYGWFWVCPNGGDKCMYRHALPVGFVLRSQKKKQDEQQEQQKITIEELIEEEVLGSSLISPDFLPISLLKSKDCIPGNWEWSRNYFKKGKSENKIVKDIISNCDHKKIVTKGTPLMPSVRGTKLIQCCELGYSRLAHSVSLIVFWNNSTVFCLFFSIQRQKLGLQQTKITLETFLEWKKRKLADKKAKLESQMNKKKTDFKQGKSLGVSLHLSANSVWKLYKIDDFTEAVLGIRVPGYLGTWIPGYLDTRVPGYPTETVITRFHFWFQLPINDFLKFLMNIQDTPN